MKKINNSRDITVRIFGITFITIFVALPIILFDRLLLNYALRSRDDLINRFVPKEKNNKINIKEIKNNEYGPFLEEGIFVTKTVFEHRHHEDQMDYLKKSNGSDDFWIFGDSWGIGIKRNEIKHKIIEKIFKKKLKNDFRSLRIISTGSWSPSLMNLAFRERIKSLEEVPEHIVFFIDQTDIGDETCRYKPWIYRDERGRLMGVLRNEHKSHGGTKLMSMHIAFGKHNSGILLFLQKLISKINYFLIKPGIDYCPKNDLLAYQLGKLKSSNGTHIKEYENYFLKSLNDLSNEIFQVNPSAKILFVTHDWAQHHISKNNKNYFPKHVKDLINVFIKSKKNIYHVNVNFLESYKGKDLSEVFLYPKDWSSHLKDYSKLSEIIAENLILGSE